MKSNARVFFEHYPNAARKLTYVKFKDGTEGFVPVPVVSYPMIFGMENADFLHDNWEAATRDLEYTFGMSTKTFSEQCWLAGAVIDEELEPKCLTK